MFLCWTPLTLLRMDNSDYVGSGKSENSPILMKTPTRSPKEWSSQLEHADTEHDNQSSDTDTEQDFPDWVSNPNKSDHAGWGGVVRRSSNYLPNFDFGRTFWRPSNEDKTCHVLGVTAKDGTKGPAHLWMIGSIVQWPNLMTHGKQPWNLRVTLPQKDVDSLVSFLQTDGVIGEEWSGSSVTNPVYIGADLGSVTAQLSLINNPAQRQNLRHMVALGRYPFSYNGVDDTNPTTPGHAAEDFFAGKLVAVEFQISSRDYRKSSTFNPLFDYSLRMQSVYLVQGEASQVSTVIDRKKGPDEWLLTPPRTKFSGVEVNPLQWRI